MRLATITTAQGPRLHVRGRSGYIDVADGTGDPRMSELAHVLAVGEPAMSAIHRLESQDGRGTSGCCRHRLPTLFRGRAPLAQPIIPIDIRP